MTSTNNNLLQALQSLIQTYLKKHHDTYEHLPTITSDQEWQSPCEQGKAKGELSYWQPIFIADLVKNDDTSAVDREQLNFANIESALGLTLHDDIKSYFTYILSADLEVECNEGPLSLLFAWNAEDFQRLQENIIGHILMKRRLKQAETIFFAVTDEDDMIISLDNATGQVWIEQVGCKPHKKLSNSLVEFIEQLTPRLEKRSD
jgi:SecY interacting protein Syd